MYLLVDAGNSFVKWALTLREDGRPESGTPNAEPADWQDSGAAPWTAIDILADAWRGRNVRGVLIANVAGENRAGQLADICRHAGLPRPEWFASVAELGGVRNGYRQPSRLGCDRFASLIGARSLYPGQAVIVATCGTATTIDALSADGRFIGGMILPGLAMMAAALAGRTAQLPQVDPIIAIPAGGLRDDAPFADHTEAAIVNGCLAAQVGAIEHARTAYALRLTGGRQTTAAQSVACILSGGAASVIASRMSSCRRVDNLVLIGLAQVANAYMSC